MLGIRTLTPNKVLRKSKVCSSADETPDMAALTDVVASMNKCLLNEVNIN